MALNTIITVETITDGDVEDEGLMFTSHKQLNNLQKANQEQLIHNFF
jgi:hypothetical protein